ncbi:UNKNOWN [Stylonychia lemnae]|uniref:Uncharacterized protein n=1 Tax=Stylonychia lemnae TaxID=5949 RepID=A0A078A1K3_STYLE|nr:UNKNOWN [Stylonychia lemnae]|eukprot:CDW76141.1 UNKNOWN [Stylonychia lemnae]
MSRRPSKTGQYKVNNTKKVAKVVAINVSPIQIDHTPEDVQKRSMIGAEYIAKQGRNKNDQAQIGISDFNSTDTSKGALLRDSLNTRGSKSCAQSPTREQDKLNNASEVLSDYANRKRMIDRYNLAGSNLENTEENGFAQYQVGIRDSQSDICADLQQVEDYQKFYQTNIFEDDLRRSKSYDKHDIEVEFIESGQYSINQEKGRPSGPQYNLLQGGGVRVQKLGSPVKLFSPAKGKGNFMRSNSLYKLQRVQQVYNNSGKPTKPVAIHLKLKKNQKPSKYLKTDTNATNVINFYSSNKKRSMIENNTKPSCLTSQGDEVDSQNKKVKSQKNSFKGKTKAMTTGYKTSEGTERTEQS